MEHYHHPDITTVKRRIVARITVMVLIWVTAFIWTVYGA